MGEAAYSLYGHVCTSVVFGQQGRRGSREAAAQVHAADLVLELKCSTAVWLLSVPWLMSCGTGWCLASRWHPYSDQSTVSKCFLTKMPPAPLSCCHQTAAFPNMWMTAMRSVFSSDRRLFTADGRSRWQVSHDSLLHSVVNFAAGHVAVRIMWHMTTRWPSCCGGTGQHHRCRRRDCGGTNLGSRQTSLASAS